MADLQQNLMLELLKSERAAAKSERAAAKDMIESERAKTNELLKSSKTMLEMERAAAKSREKTRNDTIQEEREREREHSYTTMYAEQVRHGRLQLDRDLWLLRSSSTAERRSRSRQRWPRVIYDDRHRDRSPSPAERRSRSR